MQRTNLTSLVVIGLIFAIVALVLSNKFIAKPENRTAEIEKVREITDQFNPETKTLFESENTNFSVPISLDGVGNPTPFQATVD